MMKKYLFAAFFVLMIGKGQAAGIPVIDSTNLAQNTVAALENVNQTLKQLQQYATQLQQLEEQLKNGLIPTDLLNIQLQDIMKNMLNSMKNVGSMNNLGNYGGFNGNLTVGGGGDGSGTIYGSGQTNLSSGGGAGGTTSIADQAAQIFKGPKEYHSMTVGTDSKGQLNLEDLYKFNEATYAGLELQNAMGLAYLKYVEERNEEMQQDLEKLNEMWEFAAGREGTNELLLAVIQYQHMQTAQLFQLQNMLMQYLSLQVVSNQTQVSRESSTMMQNERLSAFRDEVLE